MIYSVPYMLYFFLLLFVYGANKKYYKPERINDIFATKKRHRAELFVFFTFLVFFGLRGYLYTDCFQYVECFEEIDYYIQSVGDPVARFDWGYVICNYIISRFTSSFFVFQFIWTLIDIFLLHKILERECPEYYLLAFALLLPFWAGSQINLFRNVKTILIFFMCLPLIREKKIVKYMACIGMSFFLHSSALFFIPLYFVVNRVSQKWWAVACAISIAFYVAGLAGLFDNIYQMATLINERYTHKADMYLEDAEDAGLTFGVLFRLILMLLMLVFYNRLTIKNAIITHIGFLYLICSTAFSSVLVFRDRFGALFALGMVMVIPYLFYELRKHNVGRPIIWLLFLFIIAYLYVQTNNISATYENVLTGITDIKSAEIRNFSNL